MKPGTIQAISIGDLRTTQGKIEIQPDSDGHVSILFTDVEGSTKGWETFLNQMSASLALHDQILRDIIESAGGLVFSLAGDSFGAIFTETETALKAALKIQGVLAIAHWPDDYALRVRMSLHCGPVIQRDDCAYGPEIVRGAILCEIGHAGQILLTREVASKLDEGDSVYLGSHRLRKISDPQEVYQYGQNHFDQLRNVITRTCTVPAARSSIIGRESQISELMRLLDKNRLLTLSGPGGVGKTRLASDIALRLFEHSFDGVHLVDLGSVDHPRDLIGAFAQGLEVTLTTDTDPIAQLETVMAGRRTLLVVDNCEHVIEVAAGLIDRLLESVAGLSVLATSREPLEVGGELIWRVPPLGEGANSPAVELFLRSAQHGSGPALDTPHNRRQIDRICTLLDGLPLAIELAAARSRTLSVESIADMLEDHLRSLRLRARRNSRGRGTLNDVVAWSYQLLSEAEQTTFRRLSVFAGGFALEDVPPVIDRDADGTYDLIDSLSARSLLETVSTSSGDLRMRMLNTIRAFASTELEAHGEQQATSERHANHFLELAERQRHAFMPSPKAAQRHAAEYINLRAGADWAVANGKPELAARIATGCVIEIDRRGEFENGIRWSEGVAGGSDEVSFNALVTEAFLRGQEGNLDIESAIAQQAVQLAGDEPYRLLPVAITLASLEAMINDPPSSLDQMQRASVAAQQSDQPLFNRAFVDIHMASWDLLHGNPEALLERLEPYEGGMVPYARVCAHLLLGDQGSAEQVLRRAATAPADAWVHFSDLAKVMYLIDTNETAEAGMILADSAARHTGLRRWQDGDFLIHFAHLYHTTGNAEKAEYLIDNSRTRHGLIGSLARNIKQELQGWPDAHETPESLGWLTDHYSFESTSKILGMQSNLLADEIATWHSDGET